MQKNPFPAYFDCCPYEPLLPDYTPEEQLEAVLAKDEVMNLMGLRNYYYLTGDPQTALERLWVQSPERSRRGRAGYANTISRISSERIRRSLRVTVESLSNLTMKPAAMRNLRISRIS